MNPSSHFRVTDWAVTRAGFSVGPLELGVQPGEIVTLMGPSGIGKTTLLMTWLGFEALDLAVTGKRFQGERLLRAGEVPSAALFIPQHLPFNPNWEVESYLCRLPWGDGSIIDALWPSRPARVNRVRQVLSQLGLEHRAKATVAELSGGEAQRAALAQLLLLSPTLVVADEFVSSLDPGLAASLLDRCGSEIRQRCGCGVFALHNVHAALRVSDRVLLLWPQSVGPRPWLFESGTTGWHSDVLHTALCLAQWTKDGLSSPGVVALVKLLGSLLQDEARMAGFLRSYFGVTTVVVHPDGSIQPAGAEPTTAREVAGEWTQMSPLRILRNGSVSIGVVIPRGTSQSLSILAEAQAVP